MVMSLANAMCTNCGAPLKVDNTKDALICDFCGSAFIVEKAINKFENKFKISNSTVNIYNGIEKEFEIVASKLIRYRGENSDVKIPRNVNSIGKNAFKNLNIASITIPDSVCEIEDSAFENCQFLNEITIPNSVLRIGKSAFKNCCNLSVASLPERILEIKESLFENCEQLRTVNIPCETRIIRRFAFKNCINLESVSFNNVLSTIEERAFFNCYSIQKLTIPENVEQIYRKAFDNCIQLECLNIVGNNIFLGEFAFACCSKLEQVIYDAIKEEDIECFVGSPYYEELIFRKNSGLCLFCGGKISIITQKCKVCNKKSICR